MPLVDAVGRWSKATARLGEVVPKVESAFVAALGGRRVILSELRRLPAPRTREEVAQLQILHDRYVELIGQLGRANFALEQYIAKATSP